MSTKKVILAALLLSTAVLAFGGAFRPCSEKSCMKKERDVKGWFPETISPISFFIYP